MTFLATLDDSVSKAEWAARFAAQGWNVQISGTTGHQMEMEPGQGVPRSLDDITDLAQQVRTVDRTVPPDWTDYNGHMNEARYLHAFGDATDRLMVLVGCDPEYVASGVSFFTAETHICHLGEVNAGARIHIMTQVLAGGGKKMHLFHSMFDGERLLATGEHMMIHVDLGTRRAVAPDDRVAVPLQRIAAAHAALAWPQRAGRAVGRK